MTAVPAPTFREALRVWTRVGLQSFGGPAGQIAVMHKILVDEKRWVSEHRFFHALNFCMLLPGPEAQQLATYLGWLLHGTKGGLVAGSLFVLPGCIAILVLSHLYVGFEGVWVVTGLLFGLKAAVLAVVVEAVIRMGRRVLRNSTLAALALFAFAGLFFFAVPFPVVVIGAAAVGLVGGRLRPETFSVIGSSGALRRGVPAIDEALDRERPQDRPSLGRAFRVLAISSLLWIGPIVLLALFLGGRHVYVQEGVFFSKAAVVTFGGAYAVLAYVAQEAVEHYGWLRPDEMLDGLGMAETTPGPLIMVVQFVGFMGAYRDPGPLNPYLAGTLGALVTTWVTFAPCFLWILLGAPYVDRLRGNRSLSASLSAVTAAVVGVILNLAAWFALHVLFGEVSETNGPMGTRLMLPRWDSVDFVALSISAGAFLALLRFKAGMLLVLAAGIVAGIAANVLFD